MATEVDICNIALGYLGDQGTVSSINPPEGSAQAGRCQRYYPLARDVVLEDRNFSFSTKRATPAAVDIQVAQWGKAYALPANTLKVVAVLPPGGAQVLDDLLGEGTQFPSYDMLVGQFGMPDFEVEAAPDGTKTIYTNQEDATILYVVRVTDTNKFSQMFVFGLARMLASMLAGPIIKGKAGSDESKVQLQFAEAIFDKAATRDANQSTTHYNRDYIPSSVRARR